MAKWEIKAKNILETERKRHAAVYLLKEELYQKLHGFHPIDKFLFEKEIKNITENVTLIDSEITQITIEPRFKRSENTDAELAINIHIKGDFNGYISIETGSGYRNTNEGRIDIYYLYSSNCKVVSEKENKIKEMYKKYQKYTVEKLIDLALEKENLYLEYDDQYKNYILWHKKPSEYGDSITGDLKLYDEERNYKDYKKSFDKITKLNKFENLEEFANEVLYPSYQSTTYEWVEYKL